MYAQLSTLLIVITTPTLNMIPNLNIILNYSPDPKPKSNLKSNPNPDPKVKIGGDILPQNVLQNAIYCNVLATLSISQLLSLQVQVSCEPHVQKVQISGCKLLIRLRD